MSRPYDAAMRVPNLRPFVITWQVLYDGPQDLEDRTTAGPHVGEQRLSSYVSLASVVVLEVRNSGKVPITARQVRLGPSFYFKGRRIQDARLIRDNSSDDVPASLEFSDWHLVVSLPNTFEPGDRFVIEVALDGNQGTVLASAVYRGFGLLTRTTGAKGFLSPWRPTPASWWVVTLLIVGIACLRLAQISVSDLLSSEHAHGRLIPGDATSVVGAIVGTSGAVATIIGGIAMAFARLIKARGGAEANRVRAQADLERAKAEMRRAQAEVIRARNGLPPGVPPINNGSSLEQREPASE